VANTILTTTAVTREAIDLLHNKLQFIKTINREYDSSFAKDGAKIGTTLKIRDPNQFTVRSGAVMDTQDVAESSQTLTVATQRGVDFNFTSVERTMSMDDFRERILEPAMSRLAGEIESVVLANVYKDIYNQTGTGANDPDAFVDALNANARISVGLAPKENRFLIMNAVTMAPLVNAIGTYFHKAAEVERGFDKGSIGHAANMDFLESEMVPSHTNGTRTDTTPVVNTSSGITSGTAVITMTAFPDGLTYAAGDIFTVADVYAVNPETKTRSTHLQQFVVTAAETETGSGDMSPAVSPTPVTSGAKQNVELVSAGASKAVLNLTGGGSGAASGVYTQPLAYHKDAFTFVSADLMLPTGADAYRANNDGISMRFWQGSDIINDKHPARFDVLFGYKTLQPLWAVRVRG
jgi:hypothetical protein